MPFSHEQTFWQKFTFFSLTLYSVQTTTAVAIFQDNAGKMVPECHRSRFQCSKDDRGAVDNWYCKTCKAPVKSLLPTYPETRISFLHYPRIC